MLPLCFILKRFALYLAEPARIIFGRFTQLFHNDKTVNNAGRTESIVKDLHVSASENFYGVCRGAQLIIAVCRFHGEKFPAGFYKRKTQLG